MATLTPVAGLLHNMRIMRSALVPVTVVASLVAAAYPTSAAADDEDAGATALGLGFLATEITVDFMALADLISPPGTSKAYAIAEIGFGSVGVVGNSILLTTLAGDDELPGGLKAFFAAEIAISLVVAINGVRTLARDEPTPAGTAVAPLVFRSQGTTAAGLGISRTF